MAKVKITSTPLYLHHATKQNRASRKGAFVVLAMQKQRLFGEDANGFGNYKSAVYLAYRLKKYKRTNTNINFTLTGEMQSQYNVGFNNPNYNLGFTARANNSKNPNAPAKANALEKRFDGLFDLTAEEQSVFKQVFESEYFK